MGMPANDTVWILDDEPAVARMAQTALTARGHRVASFESPESLLQEVGTSVPSCLVTDLRLGPIDGLEVIRQVRQATWRVPAIVISGHLDVPVTIAAFREGATSVLPKPFTVSQLCDEVQSACQIARETVQQMKKRHEAQTKFDALNENQKLVLNELLKSTPHKRIASGLGISLRTVEYRRKEIFLQLGIETYAEMFELWIAANGIPTAHGRPLPPLPAAPLDRVGLS